MQTIPNHRRIAAGLRVLRSARSIASGALFLALLSGCGDRPERLPEYELAGNTMGTQYSVKLVDPQQHVDMDAVRAAISGRLRSLEDELSTYSADSSLSEFNANRTTEWQATSAELCYAVADAIGLAEQTSGAFDITVGPLVNLWGFGPGGAVAAPPDDSTIAVALKNTGIDKLEAECEGEPRLRKGIPELYVDLSAYAKGLAVDQIADTLNHAGATNYLAEIGGELRMRGHNPMGDRWAIAIEKPASGDIAVQKIVRLTDAAVATSGDYRNFFEHQGTRYSHTIDPATGRPVSHSAAAVTVVARRTAYADAIATALLVMGQEKGLAFAEREGIAAYFLVRVNGTIEERMTTRFDELAAQ